MDDKDDELSDKSKALLVWSSSLMRTVMESMGTYDNIDSRNVSRQESRRLHDLSFIDDDEDTDGEIDAALFIRLVIRHCNRILDEA